jgi:hypothetical protein|uniref:HTH HARE-type domain-containing protein n=1 Tax=candidate division WOR-3 bacterium TaxID=2052148 RepID=A0A7C6E9Z1_UNCW3
MKPNIKNLSQEIGKIVENRIRLEILKEQATRLEKELATIRQEIEKIEIGKVARKTRVVKVRRPRGEKSAKELIIEVFKRTKRPMKAKELTEKLLERGFRSHREDPSRTVDSALRANPDLFRKVAPGTFELIKG